ncbi:MAG: DUF2069 domain-containing protein [Xanthomonadales bacterium]|nr:hypothetical protein [Xanthomonadales bacterium]MCC6593472.1 DUF2069 domain-containing protein [Xanthomonadales bacterium]MCE7929887.1 DUF2069 domain-containing protein [Xanthomonadales bacterium PRO6]
MNTATRLCAASLAALVLLRLAYAWAISATPADVAGHAAIALAPLLPFVAAWAFRLRGLWIYGGIAAWVYLSHGVMEAWATPPVRAWALVETVLATLYFAAMWERTRRMRAQGAQTQARHR